MSTLLDIRIRTVDISTAYTFCVFYELRLDWDIDRHQAIALESLSPDDIRKGLIEAADLIGSELRNGYLKGD